MTLNLILDKCRAGERLSFQDGQILSQVTTDEEIAAVCATANQVRKERVGNRVLYATSLFLYPTNLCELNCQFCSFYAKPGWKKAWFHTPNDLLNQIKNNRPEHLTEIHLVGGLWRECTLDYYQELFTSVRSLYPHLHIKALTPVEYDFLAKLHGCSIEQVLMRMMDWGLGSLPGGGAEIFVESIRKQIAPGKINSEEFLHVHRVAHNLGLRSNLSMLFNHIESFDDILYHLIRTRELQDETGGLVTFIPLKFGVEDNALGRRVSRLRPKSLPLIYALCRLMLDNILHLKVLWNYVGIPEGLHLLDCGGDDFSSTNTAERVIRMAGGVSYRMDAAEMEYLLQEKGRSPYRTHSGYEVTSEGSTSINRHIATIDPDPC